MATNAGFEYQRAEEEYRAADTLDEKLKALQKMLRAAPKHKSSGNLLASIKERISKLRSIMDRQKKASKGKGYSPTVKKEGAAQVCIVGKTNTGKSSLLKELTGANVVVSDYEFTTKKPEIGIVDYQGIKIQLVEIPAIVENFEESVMGPTYLGILNQADLIILLFRDDKEKNFLDKELRNVETDKIIYNKQDKEEFSKMIWNKLKLIKIYTKQPGKEKDFPPVAFQKTSTVEDVTKKIHKDFVKNFKYAKIFGKSAKFKWQTVGKNHKLKDDDVVELHMK
tara:strand:+ start:703 stop:1545 length:843 start_codon:yes stop_codon:yes gene_type:complete